MKFLLIIFCLICNTSFAQSYKEDFNFFHSTIAANYAYFDKKQTDWDKVKAIYAPMIDSSTSREDFIAILEHALYELYDHHASLGTNTMESQKMVPSGADIWAEYVNGKPVVKDLRKDSRAAGSILAGMEIIEFNEVPVDEAIKRFLPRTLKRNDTEAHNYALRVLLAGKHSERRKIIAGYKDTHRTYFHEVPELAVSYTYSELLESKKLEDNIGYIRIHDRLWDNALIPAFDSALNALMDTKGLILDLRETPGGGNTTVARSIIGRFITKEGYYQKHEYPAEEKEYGVKRSWVEIVSPKTPAYTKRLVILVNHWTGSVGEGIAIGFDGLKRGTVVGTRMAGLLGAVYSYTMPFSGIGFNFPGEKLFHVNGTPREDYVPDVLVNMEKQKHREDLILKEGLKFFK